MKLIVLTTPHFFVEEHIIINALFEEGLDTLHLRKPNSEPIYSERLLRLIDKRWLKRIVVHDHFYLKEEFGLKGIHLNQRNPVPPLDYKGHLSRTCHTMEEVQLWKKTCNYVFLSPIFDSISNKEHQAAFTQAELEAAKKSSVINSKVIALGGITTRRIRKVKELGFGGVGVMGDLWQHFDSHASTSFAEIIKEFKALQRATGN